jgi:hypothetical protein
MATVVPIQLSDREKLEALRACDSFRVWRSLDDKRYCLRCGQIIDGRTIRLERRENSAGDWQAGCASAGCDAIPMDWVLPPNEFER